MRRRRRPETPVEATAPQQHSNAPPSCLWELLFAAAAVAHCLACPFSKVEESFNTQAAHDALFVADLDAWDHHAYPGTVPRTFLGALCVAFIYGVAATFVRPLARAFPGSSAALLRYVAGSHAPAPHTPKLAAQLGCRLVLALLTAVCFARFSRAAGRSYGHTTRCFLCVLASVQFHGPFYASRLLPNALALPLVLWAYGEALDGRRGKALFLLGAVVAAVRCDVAAVAIPLGAAWCIIERSCALQVGACTTMLGGGLAIGVSVVVDSYFWQRRVWPEGEVFLFNNPIEEKSSAWGTSPKLWYFSSALPRALGLALPLALIGFIVERRCRTWFVSAVSSVVLLSCIPHKELRFVFPALPLFNLCAAVACERIWEKKVLRVIILGIVAATLALTIIVFAPAARANYPGGVALRRLHDDWGYAHGRSTTIHLDDLACTTGASRFGEELGTEGWTYDKRDGLSDFDAFDFRLAELPVDDAAFDTLATVEAFAGLKIDVTRFPFLHATTAPRLAILRHVRLR